MNLLVSRQHVMSNCCFRLQSFFHLCCYWRSNSDHLHSVRTQFLSWSWYHIVHIDTLRRYPTVPLKKGKTYQDNSIISKEGRLKAFGQEDHVRIYGEDSLPLILNENGFSAKPIDIVKEYNSEEKKIYGFSENEVIYVCRKATST